MNSLVTITGRMMLAATIVSTAFAAVAPSVQAAGFPAEGRPVRIVVGFPPGGGADVLARSVAPGLAAKLSANVIVENRPGAGGLTATEYVAKSAPDGYTLYIATPGSFTIWPNMRKLNYDPSKDFAPISTLVTMPNLLVVSPNTPYKTVQDLIDAAKKTDAQINYASGGVATIGQIAGEQFKMMAGLKMMHVPYKGTTPALTDVMAGLVPLTFCDPTAKGMIDSGKLRLLAVTTSKRSPLFPQTPTMAEAGVPGYDLMNWYGIVAPAGTPAPIIKQLNEALVEVMAQSDVRDRLAAGGMEATSSTPDGFGQLMATERAKWGKLVQQADMRAE
ncbi:tripartite tricarboxylate transporter substrate binding protein [Bordetella muralis]|uniref:tripartite tricarboxylate transporter substrate binding protein n=1 Tax=Bordetella muralis TaxID=1649130 RepID=UPI0039EEB78D